MINEHIELLYLKGMSREALVEYIRRDNCWAFSSACRDGYLKVVKFLLEQGFVKEQMEALREYEYCFYKIKYKYLVELNIL